MPISPPQARQEFHDRNIAVKVFARDDRIYDVEARLIDHKSFAFWRVQRDIPVPAGEPLHDLRIRVTVDADLVVREIEASSDTTPFDLCREAERTLAGLIGGRIAAGWSSKVKTQLRGAASCTDLMEMLITLATPALQGIRGLARIAGQGSVRRTERYTRLHESSGFRPAHAHGRRAVGNTIRTAGIKAE